MTSSTPLAPTFSASSSSSSARLTSKSRLSMPSPNNPFIDQSDPQGSSSTSVPSSKPRATSVSSTKPPIPPKPDSNNPFRKRLGSTPLSPLSPPSSSSSTSPSGPSFQAKAPPLPPRKPSIRIKPSPSITQPSIPTPAPTLPPRRQLIPDSSSSSINSIESSTDSRHSKFPPTSLQTPSTLIQQSLLAAENARPRKATTTLQVLRRSSDASLLERPKTHHTGEGTSKHQRVSSVDSTHLDRESIISTVTAALKESEMSDIKPPPRRRPSARASGSTKPNTNLSKYPQNMKKWSCVDLLNGTSARNGQKGYAMIILNQPITRRDVFERAWDGSHYRLCADGGGNRLYDLLSADERELYLPTMIVGDLDSLRPEVRNWYAMKGVPIKQDRDEYSTDLMKCIKEIEGMEQASNTQYSLLFLGGLSGRIDQTVHTMSLMHKLRKSRPDTFVLSEESLAWVLDEGGHAIELDHSTMGQTCGILPVGVESALVKTTGLKWNLDWVTSFDGEISTSNHLLPSEPVVTITTTKPLFWCIEIRPLPSHHHSSPTPYSHTSNQTVQLAKQRTLSNRHNSSSMQEEVSKGIRELGIGVAKAAEGVKEEIGWLKGGRGGRVVSGRGDAGRERLVNGDGRDRDDSDGFSDREEVGWKMLN